MLFSDHGYKLGEHCDWFKHDNYEDSTRIVTIVKPAEGLIPNMRPRGGFVEQMVECASPPRWLWTCCGHGGHCALRFRSEISA